MAREAAAETLTIAQVEKAISVPVDQWSGNCYAIACAILRAKLVKGRPAYGHWTGPVHPRSPFAHDGKVPPIVRHGWIVLDRAGTVMDPTRWVFEHVAPYIYVGMQADDADCVDCGYKLYEHDDEDEGGQTCGIFTGPVWPYDEGGDRWRQMTQRPMPQRKAGEPLVRLVLATGVARRLGIPLRATREQLGWLANLPYATLGRDAWAVCKALEAAGCKAYIPIDTWNRADAERGL